MLHIGWGNLKKKGVALLTLPGDIAPPVSPTGRGGRYPNQVHSLTSLEKTWERNVADEMKRGCLTKKRQLLFGAKKAFGL